jgi:DNA (cytosine-5)-methyltransferase 1
MKLKAVDLFAGAGGTSLGAKDAGLDVIWASNHKQITVDYHRLNHPEADHKCQDLQQADWSQVPEHDILLASPCCQGHSRASGKRKKTMKADLSRSTAWAVVSCLEAHRTPLALIENVEDFLKWELFDAWSMAMGRLGYALSINRVNASDVGVPQNRPRIFIACTRSKSPVTLQIEKGLHVPASTIIDTTFDKNKYEWDLVTNRVPATQNRIKNGRRRYGEVFLDAAYGSEVGGRSIHKPIGAITTVNKHSLVMGKYIRPITIAEQAAAQTFPRHYMWPESKTMTKEMIGNAVPPLLAETVIASLLEAVS